MSFENSLEAEIVRKSAEPNLCVKILDYSKRYLKDEKIMMTEPQWLSFVSHVSGMVYRSVNNEKIPAVEKEIFSEISKDSIKMASVICNQLSDLQDDEKYLLSIHFEAAKQN